MFKFFKRISGIMVFVLLLNMLWLPINVPAEENYPEVSFVGIEHSPLVEGDYEKFNITSKNCVNVQYKVLIYSEKTKLTEDISSGYTSSVPASVPYEIRYGKPFSVGKYNLYIRVKRAGMTGRYSDKLGDYDSIYTVKLNCVGKDDSNRVYSDGDSLPARSTYALGERIVFNGINNIRGMKGPYKYKLHLYDASQNIWRKNITEYDYNIVWTPEKAGTYMLDVWTTSSDSRAPYEGWKLVPITVEETESLNKESAIYGSDNVENPKIFDTSVSITGKGSVLSNAVINKNLYILAGDVTLNDVTVKGSIIVCNDGNNVSLNSVKADNIQAFSGTKDKLYLKDTKVQNINIDSQGYVNLVVNGSSTIGKVNVNSDASIEAQQGSTVNVDVTGKYNKYKNVSLKGTINNLNIYNECCVTSSYDANIKRTQIYTSDKYETRLSGNYQVVDSYTSGKILVMNGTNIQTFTAHCSQNLELLTSSNIKNLNKNGYTINITGVGQVGGNTSTNQTAEEVVVDAYSTSPTNAEVKFDRALLSVQAQDFMLVKDGEIMPIVDIKIKSSDNKIVYLKTDYQEQNSEYKLYYKSKDTKKIIKNKGVKTRTVTITPKSVSVPSNSSSSFYLKVDVSNTFDEESLVLKINDAYVPKFDLNFKLDKIFKGLLIGTKIQNPNDVGSRTYKFKGDKWGEVKTFYINAVTLDEIGQFSYTMDIEVLEDDTVVAKNTFTLNTLK